MVAGTFFVDPPMPLIVLITVFLGGAVFFAAGTGFLRTVPLLLSLESLMALPLPPFGGTGGATVLFPRPTPPLVVVSVIFRTAVVPLLAFAFSTIFVRVLAASHEGAGGNGFSGEAGLERYDFPGVVGRTGDPGRVRELADRGERTWEVCSLFLDVVRAGGSGPRARFLGFSTSSFSLSAIISSLVMSINEQRLDYRYSIPVSFPAGVR